MKVWVVEWRSAAIDYGEGGWMQIKAVFSTKKAAEAYAGPRPTNLSEALLEPRMEVHEFTLDQAKSDESTEEHERST